MPTARPRHVVTETDEVAQALDEAAEHWPEDRDRRSRLLLRLVKAGQRSLQDERQDRRDTRLAAVAAAAGALTGAYEAGYLEHLRNDWPE